MLPGNLRHSHIQHQIEKLQNSWNSTINLLFLDFDGVFVVPRQNMEDYLKRIAHLAQQYQLKVVITSTWRHDMDNCHRVLDDYLEVQGRTELDGSNRSQQILNYLSTHPFKHFLILDDLFIDELQDYQVHCDYFTGFDEKAYEKAVQILKKQAEKI